MFIFEGGICIVTNLLLIMHFSNNFAYQKYCATHAVWALSRPLECTKTVGGRGFAPDPTGGAYSAPPDPLAGFRGRRFAARGGGGEGKGGEVKGGKGRQGRGEVPHFKIRSAPTD